MGSRHGLVASLIATCLAGVYASGPVLAQPPTSLAPPPAPAAPPSASLSATPSAAPAAPAASPTAGTPSPMVGASPVATPPAPGAVPPPSAPAEAMGGPTTATPAPPPTKPAVKPLTSARVAPPDTAKPGAGLRETTTGIPHTLSEALAATYSNQPTLLAERAHLRSVDENVPTALAGWRPTVEFSASAGYGSGISRGYSYTLGRVANSPFPRDIATGALQAQETLYNGGKTQATINHAKNAVMAERATLIAQEQTSFTNAVNAYVNVISAQQTLELNRNNEIVLQKQLQATNDRFRVGEITRTDVAQAEAALSGATAQRQTSEGQLQSARGVFQQVIGVLPPDNLVPPQPLAFGMKDVSEAIALAANNNPQVIAAAFNDAAAKDQVDIAFAALLPSISLQGQMFQQQNAASWATSANGYQVTANLAVPLYQGGSEYSAVRQAKQSEQTTARQLDDARRTAVQNAVSAWETLVAAYASADSTRAQIRANEIALEGVEREAIVGSRTTLDVLNAEQTLLNSQTSLVQNLAQLIQASYGVAAAIGRLTARDLHLPVPLYDETAYYNAVKDKWGGLGDYATNQPGR